jgi:hypothetical protein
MICRGLTAGSFAIAGLFQHAREKAGDYSWVGGDEIVENQGLTLKFSQGAEPFALLRETQTVF